MVGQRKQSYEQTFREEVVNSFAFLRIDHDFHLVEDSDYVVTWSSPKCRVQVVLDRHQVFLTVEPIDDNKTPSGAPNAIGLELIMKCLRSESDYDVPTDLRVDQVPEAVQRLAKLLKQYCTPFLEGNFADWERVKSCALSYVRAMNSKYSKS